MVKLHHYPTRMDIILLTIPKERKFPIYHMMAYVESGFLPTDKYTFDYLKVVFGSFGIPLEKAEKEVYINYHQ